MSLLNRIYNLPDFVLRCEGLECDREDIQRWLRTDTPYLQFSEARRGFYYVHVALHQEEPHPYFTIRAMSNRFSRARAEHWSYSLMMAQDMICTLERRGLHVIYVEGDLAWEQ